jgi:hypothetical protein
MIRASQVHKICTNRPVFDPALLESLEQQILSKDATYTRETVWQFTQTRGVMTIAKDIIKQLENQRLVEADPLPEGAMSYLQELWLEENGFYDFSVRENLPQFVKGKTCEEEAIALIGEVYNINISKNVERVTKDFITGECDIQYGTVIRDCKIPESWKTYRNKQGIPSEYYWQLIAYCYLYDKTEAYLDYVLMPTPDNLIDYELKGLTDVEKEKYLAMQAKILTLTPKQRVKTFPLIVDLQKEIDFLCSRLMKAKEYYNTLSLEICLRLC